MLRKASRAWGIAPARILPENLPLAAFLHGDHPFGFESPAKPFLNEKKIRKPLSLRIFLAEREGFEPSVGLWPTHDFQSCALDQLSHLSICFLPCLTALVYHTGFFGACQHLKYKFSIKNPAPGNQSSRCGARMNQQLPQPLLLHPSSQPQLG